ncbi:MAG: 30S ribosomal protein S16 [Candidatus Portnoybacteria bacterium RBG_19FT_COMBO_36_7]|uniref:Small ribosomal subunit protein bS16 n=1 Tax=Candidatus Portnoybacteria bacterium RBG_19FT_COMBO_36_7 TaxID=1801992 RepID=A0A1G2F9H2_9BACT|nr:MAG: 30S ribosomal protein S16 [Candidatus Portnoybacteria bacterium RBG_19FT_COMBO_36_7]
MLIIRFTRRGRKNDPSFRLVVTEQSNPVKGKFLEELGFYNPKLKTKSFQKERILYWISKGAKCSATVNNLLISESIIEGKKVKAWRPKKKTGEAAAAKTEVKEEKKAPEVATEPAPEAKEEKVEEPVLEKKEEKAERQPESQEMPKNA